MDQLLGPSFGNFIKKNSPFFCYVFNLSTLTYPILGWPLSTPGSTKGNSFANGSRAFADLRYGEEDSISPSTQIFPATKG